ncbi:MAG TPA: AI-2E family transporter [Candidatus Dormibacteraeota bacterium]|jgi:predicted PurR-regulated permease PerM|nr:AI-2E family transporter [Candidatus Dormibacteraeota bacterium]
MAPEEGTPGGGRRQPRWSDLYGPVRVLVYLLILVALFQIYQDAQFAVNTILGVLLLFVFAGIIAMLLTPLVDRIEMMGPLRGRRGVAVLVLNAAVILVLAGILAILIPPIATQGAAFVTTFPKVVNDIQGLVNDLLNELSSRGIPVQAQIPQNLAGTVLAPVLGSAVQIITGTLGAAVNLILVTVIAIYLQVEGRGILASLRQLFPRQQQLFDFTVVAAGSTLAGYVRGQLIFAAIMAGYTGVTLSVIGVKFALAIAAITFFLELIPLIGAPVAMALAVGVALLSSPLVILLTAIATVGGHVVGAYTIGLKIYGQSAKVHPLVAMGALVLGAQLGGVLGALFAIPVAGILNVYLGALYRARSGGDAFGLPTKMSRGEEVLEDLPNLGEEISQKADEAEEAEGLADPGSAQAKKDSRAGEARGGQAS